MDGSKRAQCCVVAAAAGGVLAATFLVTRRRRQRLTEARAELSKRLASKDLLSRLQRRADFVDDFLAYLIIEGVAFLSHVDSDGKRIPYATAAAAQTAVKLKTHTPPVALVPAPIPADKYLDAVAASHAVCRLIDCVATDPQWLRRTFGHLASFDEWTGKMLRLAEEVDTGDKIRLHVMRNDLMLDSPNGAPWRQIEVNTFSASLPGQVSHLSAVHRRLLQKHLRLCGLPEAAGQGDHLLESILPANGAVGGIADGMAAAHRLYRKRYGPAGTSEPVLLFVVVPEEYNEADHRMLEWELGERGVTSIRRTMEQILAGSHMQQVDRGRPRFMLRDLDVDALWHEVSVCYFRWGWTRVEGGWQWRRELAQSACVEVPSAGALLAGLKLSQAACAEAERLRELRGLSGKDRALLLSIAARQFYLGAAPSRGAAREALAERPDGFLAKPGRDGLGSSPHRFAHAELLQLLDDADGGQGLAQGWVIMEKVRPPVHASLVLHTADFPPDTDARELCSLRPSVAELGIYAVGLAPGAGGRLETSVAGHLVRSKDVSSEDGGVCRGNAVVDAPLLCSGEWACHDTWSDAVNAAAKVAGAFQSLGA